MVCAVTVREDGSVFPAEEHPSMIALRTGKAVRNIVMGAFNPTLGERRWISIDTVPKFSNNSPSTFETFTEFEDFTERKIADRALRESEARLMTTVGTQYRNHCTIGLGPTRRSTSGT